MKRRITARAIIVRDGKILAIKNKQYNPYVNVEEWSTPGGGIDSGESLIPALQRELMEELGVHAVVGNLLYVQQCQASNLEHMQFFFHIVNADDFIHIDLTKTTHGIEEIERVEFISFSTPTMKPEFLTLEPVVEDIRRGGATKFFSTLENVSA